MMLDPRDRKSWQGFLGLLQPPSGYRLSAALGTSFGLSIDALTAALLAMCDADGEGLAHDPVASVLALTRLRSKVRVLVHRGTISGRVQAGSTRYIALLDRLLVEVQPTSGLFHPKVWALQFDRLSNSSSSRQPESIGRVVVSSRNLALSTAFELGAVFEGPVAATGRNHAASAFSSDVGEALQAWLSFSRAAVPNAIAQLPRFIQRVDFAVPREAQDSLRVRWQGAGRQPLSAQIPMQIERAVVLSPFVQPGFLTAVASRTKQLQVVSTPEALDALDDETFSAVEGMRERQGTPVLYQVGGIGEPEAGFIEGLHAKVLLVEGAQGEQLTLVGSANATGPGWGLVAGANVEAMVEMRPGIGIDRFISAFVRETKTKIHPWMTEYDRTARNASDPEREAERALLAALRDLAGAEFKIQYDAAAKRLTVVVEPRAARVVDGHPDLEFSFAPLLLTDRAGGWTPIRRVATRASEFNDVPLDGVTAFVAVRARSSSPQLERTRLVLGHLDMSEADLDSRDALVRKDILTTADPATVLNALIRGLSYISNGSLQPAEGHGRNGTRAGIQHLFQEATLERLLQVVAIEPTLIPEMRMLLGPSGGKDFHRFCDDLEEALRQVELEVVS
jgi:hypothetical protein